MPKKRESKKKKWIIPQLIVLVRGKPGEGSLVSCKTISYLSHNPTSYDSYCYYGCSHGTATPCNVNSAS